jgi:hypothetical protein
MTDDGTGITYMTPAMDFSKAKQMIKGYRFSSFVRVDASPEKIVITFLTGYEEKFFNGAYLPAVNHTIGTYSFSLTMNQSARKFFLLSSQGYQKKEQ